MFEFCSQAGSLCHRVELAIQGIKTLLGIEPNRNCFAGSCLTIWLQRRFVTASLDRKREWDSNPQSRDFKSRRYSGLRTAPEVSLPSNNELFAS